MTTTPTQHEAEVLADALEAGHLSALQPSIEHLHRIPALLAEKEALKAEVTELDDLRDRLSTILKSTAIAIRGPEPELTSWGWADLPERVEALKARVAELEAQLERTSNNRDMWRGQCGRQAAQLEAQRVALTDEQIGSSLREAAQNALVTLDGIADTNPRNTADFEMTSEWIAWAKSRARWAAEALRAPVAQEIYAERILKKMLDDEAHGITSKEGGQ